MESAVGIFTLCGTFAERRLRNVFSRESRRSRSRVLEIRENVQGAFLEDTACIYYNVGTNICCWDD